MSTQPRYVEERERVMLGNLPEDFLRVSSPCQEATPVNATSHQVQNAQYPAYAQGNTATQITICITQAQLAKNYSITKMDPYVRVRIGHSVFETHSDNRGGKFPNWNKTITSYLPQGIKTIHIEVFDEHTLTPDERIAYADYIIPEEAFQGKFIDTWVLLSGKQGEEKEGSINITLHLRAAPCWPTVFQSPMNVGWAMPQPMLGVMPGGYVHGQPVPMQYPMQQPLMNPHYAYPMAQQQPQPYTPTEDDTKQLQEMFPSFDQEVIIGVLENCRGNKEQAITALLSLSDK